MGIEGITNAQIIQRLKNIDSSSQAVEQGAEASRADEVNISKDAKLAQTLNRSMKAIEEAPDVRQDKIADVMDKLESGFYETDEVMDKVAERATQDLIGF